MPSLHVLVFGKKTFVSCFGCFFLCVLKCISLGIPVGWCQCAWGSLFAEEHLGIRVLWCVCVWGCSGVVMHAMWMRLVWEGVTLDTTVSMARCRHH